MLVLVVLADDRAAATVARAADSAPARPEDERQERADGADGEEDPPDGVDLDAADRCVDGPDQDRSNGDEKKADSHTHFFVSFRRNAERNSPCLQGKRGNRLRRYGRCGTPRRRDPKSV